MYQRFASIHPSRRVAPGRLIRGALPGLFFLCATLGHAFADGTKAGSPGTAEGQARAALGPAAGVVPTHSLHNALTGEATFRLSLPLPRGRDDLTPDLGLRYASEGEDSEVGRGWSYGYPSLVRDTSQGAPSYTDADRLRFGGTPLVRIGTHPLGVMFRLSQDTGTQVILRRDATFLVRHKDGVQMRYVPTMVRTNAAPNTDAASEVLAWSVARVTDRNGNIIDFEYGRPPGEANEKGASSRPSRLLAVRYGGNDGSYSGIALPHLFRVTIFRDGDPAPQGLRLPNDAHWPTGCTRRATSLRAGGEVDHGGPMVRAFLIETAFPGTTSPETRPRATTRTAAAVLHYAQDAVGCEQPFRNHPELTRVDIVREDEQGSLAYDAPLELGYYSWERTFGPPSVAVAPAPQPPEAVTLASPRGPRDVGLIATVRRDEFDFDRTGRVNAFGVAEDGSLFVGPDRGAEGPAMTLGSVPWAHGQVGWTLDGLPYPARYTGYLTEVTSYQSFVDCRPGGVANGIVVQAAEARLMDVSGDGVPDRVVTQPDGSLVVYPGLPGEGFGPPFRAYEAVAGQYLPLSPVTDVTPLARCVPSAGSPQTSLRLSTTVDLNGDGLVDFITAFPKVDRVGSGSPDPAHFSVLATRVSVSPEGLVGILNFGRGFVAGRTASVGEPLFAAEVSTEAGVRAGLFDFDGDGLSDFVSSEGYWRQNLGGVLGPRVPLSSALGHMLARPDPTRRKFDATWVDVNGDGRPDPVDESGLARVDSDMSAAPGRLRSIRHGGYRAELRYELVRDTSREGVGRWAVSELHETTQVDSTITTFRHEAPRYGLDPRTGGHLSFRGFGKATECSPTGARVDWEWGPEGSPLEQTPVSHTIYTTCTATEPASRKSFEFDIQTQPTESDTVVRIRPSGVTHTDWAAGQAVVRSQVVHGYAPDELTVARITDYGFELDPDDDRALETDYVLVDTASRYLMVPTGVRTVDPKTFAVASSVEYRYDGLEKGQASRGLVTSVETEVTAERTAVVEIGYDAFGHQVRSSESGRTRYACWDALKMYPVVVQDASGARTTKIVDYATSETLESAGPIGLPQTELDCGQEVPAKDNRLPKKDVIPLSVDGTFPLTPPDGTGASYNLTWRGRMAPQNLPAGAVPASRPVVVGSVVYGHGLPVTTRSAREEAVSEAWVLPVADMPIVPREEIRVPLGAAPSPYRFTGLAVAAHAPEPWSTPSSLAVVGSAPTTFGPSSPTVASPTVRVHTRFSGTTVSRTILSSTERLSDGRYNLVETQRQEHVLGSGGTFPNTTRVDVFAAGHELCSTAFRDAWGRTISSRITDREHRAEAVTTFGYANGVLAQVSEPNPAPAGGWAMTEVAEQDTFGRTVESHNPEGARHRIARLIRGGLGAEPPRYVTQQLDPQTGLLARQSELDGQGRVRRAVEFVESRSLTTDNEYDAAGRLVRSTAPDGVVTTHRRDMRGQLLELTREHLGSRIWAQSFEHNDWGELVATTNGEGLVTRFVRDPMSGRVTLRDVPSVAGAHAGYGNVTFEYYTSTQDSGLGQVRTTTSPVDDETFEYDGMGRVSRNVRNLHVTTPAGPFAERVETTFRYGPMGQVIERSVQVGSEATKQSLTTSYTYTSRGQLSEIRRGRAGDSSAPRLAVFEYNLAGMPVRRTDSLGDGSAETRTYDALGRSTAVEVTAGARRLYRQDARYNLRGHPDRIVTDLGDGAGPRSMSVTTDRLGRLTDATQGDYELRVRYAGTRIASLLENVPGSPRSSSPLQYVYGLDPAAPLALFRDGPAGPDTALSLRYNGAGALVERDGRTLVADATGKLLESEDEIFYYGASGLRDVVFDKKREVVILSVPGLVTAEYKIGPDRQDRTRLWFLAEGVLVGEDRVHALHTDTRGAISVTRSSHPTEPSVRQQLDAFGSTIARVGGEMVHYDGIPFATDLPRSPFVQFGNRSFDRMTKRWTSPDPLYVHGEVLSHARGNDPYNFNFDNPLVFADPDGLQPYDDSCRLCPSRPRESGDNPFFDSQRWTGPYPGLGAPGYTPPSTPTPAQQFAQYRPPTPAAPLVARVRQRGDGAQGLPLAWLENADAAAGFVDGIWRAALPGVGLVLEVSDTSLFSDEDVNHNSGNYHIARSFGRFSGTALSLGATNAWSVTLTRGGPQYGNGAPLVPAGSLMSNTQRTQGAAGQLVDRVRGVILSRGQLRNGESYVTYVDETGAVRYVQTSAEAPHLRVTTHANPRGDTVRVFVDSNGTVRVAETAAAQVVAPPPVAPVAVAPMFGARGTQVTSQTVWNGPNRMRIDVENPNPGVRPGMLHLQQGGRGATQLIWNPATRTFDGMSRAQQAAIQTPSAQRAIQQGLRMLGEL